MSQMTSEKECPHNNTIIYDVGDIYPVYQTGCDDCGEWLD